MPAPNSNNLTNLYRRIEKHNPELFKAKPLAYTAGPLKGIGITYPIDQRQIESAYIKLFPEDFIVEEISLNHQIARVKPKETRRVSEASSKGKKYYLCQLIKKGLGHREAIRAVAGKLNLKLSQIKYAGIKDKNAWTAQFVTIPIAALDKAPALQTEKLNLFTFGAIKTPLHPGRLRGNFFTITCRTRQRVDQEQLQSQVNYFQKNGVLNFFGPQRFTRNLASHLAAYHYIRGELEQGLKIYLTSPGYTDSPLINQIRKFAAENWGNWEAIVQEYQKFPMYMHLDLRIFKKIRSTQGNFAKVILSERTYFDVQKKALTSYLFNRLLSDKAQAQELSKNTTLPLLNQNPQNLSLYQPYLKELGCKNPQELTKNDTLEMFQLSKQEHKLPAITPFIGKIRFNFLRGGVRLSFGLPKGSYATTFLMQLFTLFEQEPVPAWVWQDKSLKPHQIQPLQ